MGIQDRDYMHERRTSTDKRRPVKRMPQQNLPIGKILLGIALFAAVLVPLVSRYGTTGGMKGFALFERNVTGDADFPETGDAHWYVNTGDLTERELAPLRIKGVRGGNPTNMVVRLDDWETKQPIVFIPVRAGETASVEIPLGRYRFVYATQSAWRGPLKLLGKVKEAQEPLDFYRTAKGTVGYTIDLHGRINGNMKSHGISSF